MNLRFGFLRLSTIKCPHLIRSDHRELRNSSVKLMWWLVGVEARGQTRILARKLLELELYEVANNSSGRSVGEVDVLEQLLSEL